jgi:hypothetical protein
MLLQNVGLYPNYTVLWTRRLYSSSHKPFLWPLQSLKSFIFTCLFYFKYWCVILLISPSTKDILTQKEDCTMFTDCPSPSQQPNSSGKNCQTSQSRTLFYSHAYNHQLLLLKRSIWIQWSFLHLPQAVMLLHPAYFLYSAPVTVILVPHMPVLIKSENWG